MNSDDWGRGLGEDPDQKRSTSAPKKGSRTALVRFFDANVPADYALRLNAPTNGKALMKAFATLVAHGYTDDEIRQMILRYMQDISRRPLPSHVSPWRGFIANLDRLAKEIEAQPQEETTSEAIVDPRLFSES